MLLAVLIFAATIALVIWQPKGLGIGWSAMGGAVVALLAGVVTMSDVPVVCKDMTKERAGLTTRVADLHEALEISGEDDPKEAARKLKGKGAAGDVREIAGLPFWGALLLFGNLARIEGIDGFRQVPTTVYPGNGDEWYALVDEAAAPPAIVIGVRYDQFGHSDAQIKVREAESRLATALQGIETCKKQIGTFDGRRPDPVALKAYEDRHDQYVKEARENRAIIREYGPKVETPGGRTWRFAGSSKDFGTLRSFLGTAEETAEGAPEEGSA